jgi:hypothetical protein
MRAVQQLGVFWGAVNEPPPYTAGKEQTSMQGGGFVSHGKKEVKNENSTLHPAFGG